MEIRPLALDDDLMRVSELIYLTDKYIYPSWLGSIERAKTVLPYMIKRDTLYSYKNIIVADINGDIAGYICFMDKYPVNNYDEMISAYQDGNLEIDEGFEHVNKGYFEEMDFQFVGRYLLGVAVLPQYQHQGIGKRMLEYFGNRLLSLAAVKDNYNAIALYKKCGFEYMYDYPGYKGILCVEMIKKEVE